MNYIKNKSIIVLSAVKEFKLYLKESVMACISVGNSIPVYDDQIADKRKEAQKKANKFDQVRLHKQWSREGLPE